MTNSLMNENKGSIKSRQHENTSSETVSALMDGEAGDWELRKVLKVASESDTLGTKIKDQWRSYQAISQMLAKEPIANDISQVVSAAITNEKQQTPSYWAQIKAPLKQMTIAASVTVVCLLGLQQYKTTYNDAIPGESSTQVASAESSNEVLLPPEGFVFQPMTQTVSSTAKTGAVRSATNPQQPTYDKAQLQMHLQYLLKQHAENSLSSNQTITPIVRMASKEQKP